MRSSLRLPATTLLTLALAACGGDQPESAPPPAVTPGPDAAPLPATPTVTILEPAQGAEVEGPAVMVRLAAEGVEIVPAGEIVPGTGHHHLYLDTDLSDPAAPVPTVPDRVIHLGTGVSEYTFANVPAGEHRLIAVVADGIHVPLQPWVVDTVVFVVR